MAAANRSPPGVDHVVVDLAEGAVLQFGIGTLIGVHVPVGRAHVVLDDAEGRIEHPNPFPLVGCPQVHGGANAQSIGNHVGVSRAKAVQRVGSIQHSPLGSAAQCARITAQVSEVHASLQRNAPQLIHCSNSRLRSSPAI